ncbi:MAG TPA: transcription termination factor Rho [Acidimicrobiales bacterium]|jgi:transcription termination factor Rho|nr:transcription termination factor Rho [Acidimicrobiales bacterium]
MSDLQLERSVLEAKEREELFAIADALGTKPTTRAKKADLIGQILRATGVEGDVDSSADPVTEKPKRTRARKVAGADPGPAASEHAEAPDGAGAELDVEPGAGQLGLDVDSDGRTPASSPAPPSAPARAATGARSDSTGAQSPQGSAPRQPVEGDPVERTSAPRADDEGDDRSHQGFRPSPPPPRDRNGSDRDQGGAPRDQSGTPRDQNGDRAARFDGEPGNRRNRRRRGRDRSERGERDLQGPGGAPEQTLSGEAVDVKGFLDLRDEGYGFLRTAGFLAGPDDVYVSISQVRRFALRKGDHVEGTARPAGSTEKYPALLRIDTIGGLTAEEARNRPRFEDLTPLFPDHKLRLEVPGDPANMTARIVDLISPIGKGQRGLIVSPPKAGKTTVLKQIAHSIEANNPDVHLMVLLVDERPEEVTDMRRSVKGEVVASTFDRPSEEHTQVAELAIERAKRLVEAGRDVVIVLDGITRLARAYNLAQPTSGRIMSGGIDTGALYPPKKFFGSARNIEEGGSLTILATALVETGSRMDEVIFEEFKGTGNMELRLDRRLAERRVYPAIEVNGSSTRHEELLFDRAQLQQVWKLRRVLNALGGEGSSAAGLELLMEKIKSTRSNDEFLAEIAKTPAPGV